MYIPLKFENNVHRTAFVDTGACANAMPADYYAKLEDESANAVSELQEAPLLNVKIASGRLVDFLAQIEVKFKLNNPDFQGAFVILPSINCVVLAIPFFKKYNMEISPGENFLKLP